MKWQNIEKIFVFAFVWILAITAIENKGEDLLLNMAGDFLGSMALMTLAIRYFDEEN
jgi:hypothetical protein